MRGKNLGRVVGLLGVAVGTMQAPGVAGAEDAVVVGPEMVVTASRGEMETGRVPAGVTVITADDLRRTACLTVVDALKSTEGVYVRSISGGPATAEVAMRGFGENAHGRVLVLLDGQKINRPDMASINWMQIPMNNIERIEVVRGGQSALYGDHAVAGVINIITRKGEGDGVSGEVSAEAGSFGSMAAQVGVSGKAEALAYSVNASTLDSDGYRDRTGSRSWGGGTRLGYDLDKDNRLSLSLTWSDVNYEIPGWLSETQMAQDRKQSLNPDDSAYNQFFSSDLGFSLGLGGAQRLEAGISYGRQDLTTDMTSWMSYTDVLIDTIGLTPRYVNAGPLGGHANSFMLGLDYYLDMLDSRRFADAVRTQESIDASVEKGTLGAHVQDTFGLTEKLALGAGLRVETAEFSGRGESMGMTAFDDSQSHTATAADGSLLWAFDERSKAFLRGGSIYRYPFVDEQIVYSGYGADQFYTDLDPEQGWNLELGGQATLRKDVDVGLTLYRLDMSDEIAWNAMEQKNENIDKTSRQGVEINAAFRVSKDLSLNGNYTFTDARFTDGANDGNRIPLVPEHKTSVGAQVGLPYDLNAGVIATYVGDSYLGGDNGNLIDRLGDYTVVDATLRYLPQAVAGLELFMAVDNLFNEKYASLGYVGWNENGYYPAPETGFRAGAAYRF